MIGAARKSRPALSNMSPQQTSVSSGNNPMMPQQEVWTSTEDLFWDHMREVQNKWNTLKLNDDIWAKLIYFEQNRRLAKAYVSTPVLTIDGSTNGLDGFRIGLSGIENSYRDLDSIACLRSIGQGVKLKIDHQGNILIRKLAPSSSRKQVVNGGAAVASNRSNGTGTGPGPGPATSTSCSVLVKRWPPKTQRRQAGGTGSSQLPPASSASSNSSDYSQLSSSSSSSRHSPNGSLDGLATSGPVQEICDHEQSHKLFDMQNFRRQLERNRLRTTEARNLSDGTSTTPIDWRQCVSIISFNQAGSRLDRARPLRPNQRANQFKGMDTIEQQQHEILADPCWLMLINIIAIDMLKSSLCDSRPQPAGQMSALINRFHSDSAKQQRNSSSTNSNNNNGNPKSSQAKRLASTESSELCGDGEVVAKQPAAEGNYGFLNGRSRPRADSQAQIDSDTSSQQHQQQQQQLWLKSGNNELAANGGDPQHMQSPDRLKRLNRLRQDRLLQEQTNPSLHQSRHQLAADSARRMDDQPRSSRSSSQQQLEGSIYTTFTGKYLDKQHRLRANQRSANQSPGNNYASCGDEFRPPEVGRKRRIHQGSHLLYPADSLVSSATRNRYTRRDLAEVTAGTPYGGPHARRYAGRDSHLTHSLSAFDLSHGLKLNLRLINSSSIKMNFDSDEQEEDEGECADYGDEEIYGHAGRKLSNDSSEGLVARLDLNNGTKRSVLSHSKQIQMTRRSLKALGDEASEWNDLARKYSIHSQATSPNDTTGQGAPASRVKSIESIVDDGVVEAENQEDCVGAERGMAEKKKVPVGQVDEMNISEKLPKGKLQQNVSHASIASSSSGCADNDYFNSQSSNSSMSSSSTRSNEGEELSSQPASSSGIICSGNTSDEYERHQAVSQSAQASGNPAASKRDSTHDHRPQQQQQQQQLERDVAPKRLNVKQRAAAARQAISRSRALNKGKGVAVAASSSGPEDTDPGCGVDCEHQSGGPEHHRSQCDCGAPSCDELLNLDHLSNEACDCFCDCPYEADLAPEVPSARCQDKLCNCDELNEQDMIGGGHDCSPMGQEEPIYDQLPRLSGEPMQNGKSRSNYSKNGPTPTRPSTRAMSKYSDEKSVRVTTLENYDRIVPLPGLHESESSQQLDKSKKQYSSTNELKRNKGWLESRKYIKLFPRFIFSSSTSSPAPANQNQEKLPKKSGTLDRVDQFANKFRRTRSSQNLSK